MNDEVPFGAGSLNMTVGDFGRTPLSVLRVFALCSIKKGGTADPRIRPFESAKGVFVYNLNEVIL